MKIGGAGMGSVRRLTAASPEAAIYGFQMPSAPTATRSKRGGAPQATSRSNPRRRRRASLRPMRRDSREGSQRADTPKPAERKQTAASRCTKKTRQPPALGSPRASYKLFKPNTRRLALRRRPTRSPRRGLCRVAKWPSQAAHPPRVVCFR